jgi:Leucine-rich repeat (LRR) protein
MCLICTKEYNTNTTSIYCCENTQVRKMPKELINLEILYCHETQIKKIPKTLIKLEMLNCQNTEVRKIPKTLINLKELYCNNSQIKKIPKTLINLKYLYCAYTQIKFIPNIIKNLEWLNCGSYILVSPQTYKLKSNNKRYLTFTRCQVRYKSKLRRTSALRSLKFAYDPKYIIGYNTKKQLEKLFKGPPFQTHNI